MKKFSIYSMLAISVTMLTCCTQDDPYASLYNNFRGWDNTNTSMSNGSSSTTGELASFDIVIDKTSAEPQTTASEYYPDEEDVFSCSDFTTEVSIDLSNPKSKTENGVEVLKLTGRPMSTGYRSNNISEKLEWRFNDAWSAYIRGSYYDYLTQRPQSASSRMRARRSGSKASIWL